MGSSPEFAVMWQCAEHVLAGGSVAGVNVHANPSAGRFDSPSVRSRWARRCAVTAAIIAGGVFLAGCTQQMVGNAPTDDGSGQPLAGERSVPDPSPAAQQSLVGRSGTMKFNVTDVSRVGADEHAPDIAVLREGSLLIGTPDELTNNTAATVDVDKSCHNLSASNRGVAVACQGELLEFDAEAHKLAAVAVDGRALSGTFDRDGRAVAGVEGKDRVYFFDASGKEVASEVVTQNVDESLLVNTGPDQDPRVAVIDRSQTRINDVSIGKPANNAALRIGQGVGEVAAGRGNDGVVVASDHRQNQVQIFTMLDVVRLHQAAPTGQSPWAVAWDAGRHLAWVSTTGDNKLTAMSIDSGVPRPVAQIDTIANVRSVIDTADGGLMLVSDDGQWQMLSAQDIAAAQSKGVAGAPEYSARIVGGRN